ncbi:MAG: hypothetical protein K5894_16350 [Lachnospiraceae bacterium]|nr:hypothetical protein [Lachnospiraceae bacterium]
MDDAWWDETTKIFTAIAGKYNKTPYQGYAYHYAMACLDDLQEIQKIKEQKEHCEKIRKISEEIWTLYKTRRNMMFQ